jgi:nucleoside 2-deoxyribosyltransferase
MQAFISIKHYQDNRNRSDIERLSSIIAKSGFQTVCIVRDYEAWGEKTYSSNELMQITFNEIAASDVLVVESSVRGVGLGIEAGYAFARGVPILVVARSGAVISATLSGIASAQAHYSSDTELEQFLSQELAAISAGKNN